MSSHESDYLLALKLQEELNGIEDNHSDVIDLDSYVPPMGKLVKSYQAPKAKRTITDRENEDDLNATKHLVHPMWESLDPTPDVHSLFGAFNSKFFQSRLHCVELEWSKRMYSCAGICYSRRNRMGQQVTIRLSEPLLKLRSRKDLVETLLHEMIHAYCFVLNIREGNGGHGPNFKKIMFGINKVAGTNITVYHSFHDEVDVYKTHVWRCNGVCQNREPFLGYVKRTSNRAPGPNDFWWAGHQSSCGGMFLKVKEPEKKKRLTAKELKSLKSKEIKANNTSALTNYFNKTKGPMKTNGGGTLLINPKTKTSTKTTDSPVPAPTPLQNKTGGNLKNVMGFRDLTESGSDSSQRSSQPTAPGGNLKNVRGFRDLGDSPNPSTRSPVKRGFDSGQGYSLTSSSSSNSNVIIDLDGPADKDHLRNVWANRFSNTTNTPPDNASKKRRISIDKSVPVEQKWKPIDNDILISKEDLDFETIDLDSEDEEDFKTNAGKKWSQENTQEARDMKIKQEIIDESLNDLNGDDIELLDDDYDDKFLETSSELADTSLIDDLFGEDTLMKTFNAPSTSKGRSDNVSCPICQMSFHREFLGEHLDGCSGMTVQVQPKRNKNWLSIPTEGTKKASQVTPRQERELLKSMGYSEADISKALGQNSGTTSSSVGSKIAKKSNEEMAECPVCMNMVPAITINQHLDNCLY
ncbi:SPRTN family protein [Megaselia abdita]